MDAIDIKPILPITDPVKPKHAGGRPRGPRDEKGKMLRELKKIWSNPTNKKNEIISAATIYAELMGWKVKSQEPSTQSLKGDIMKIEFIKETPKPVVLPDSIKEPASDKEPVKAEPLQKTLECINPQPVEPIKSEEPPQLDFSV